MGGLVIGNDSVGASTVVPSNSNPSFSSYQSDAFGALRVAAPFTLADLISKYGRDSREWDAAVVGGGTVTDDLPNSAIVLSVGAPNADAARLRTQTFFRYQAGKGLTFRLTCYHADSGKANQTRRWGYYDDDNGLFWKLVGAAPNNLSIVCRTKTSGVVLETQTVAQAAWNRDPLNGAGASGVTLDVTKGNIYEIRFQWLGVGTVSFYVNGILVHQFANPNTLASAYMTTATLPAAAEVINTGASTASSMHVICCTVLVDGGQQPPQYSYTYSGAVVAAVGAGVSVAMVAMRPRALFGAATPFNQLTNRCLVVPAYAGLSSEVNRCSLAAYMNPTFTFAGGWASFSDFSCVEINTTMTINTATGERIDLRFGPGGAPGGAVAELFLAQLFGTEVGQRQMRQSGFVTVPPTLDTIVLVATNEAAGNTDFRASLTWGEVR